MCLFFFGRSNRCFICRQLDSQTRFLFVGRGTKSPELDLEVLDLATQSAYLTVEFPTSDLGFPERVHYLVLGRTCLGKSLLKFVSLVLLRPQCVVLFSYMRFQPLHLSLKSRNDSTELVMLLAHGLDGLPLLCQKPL